MPNYPALAAQGIYTDAATGIRVFAGQRAETFYIDLGAVFDTVNLRRNLPALTGPGEDSDTVNPFGVNRFSGANVTHHRHRGADQVDHPGWQAGQRYQGSRGRHVCHTARQRQREFRSRPGDIKLKGPWVQVRGWAIRSSTS